MAEEDDALILGLAKELRARGWFCATAESCTGGMIGAALTAVPGSSEWYAGGVVSYSNRMKEKLLGVSRADLDAFGAVSRPVVMQMARGACAAAEAECAVSTSGIAGPGGGSPEKPVGTVWIGWSVSGRSRAEECHFSGGRDEVRRKAVRRALQGLAEMLEEEC